jgi:CheY-like chemotaxis protein
VMLADDDADDRELFIEVIATINKHIQVESIADSKQLMDVLKDGTRPLPDILFLDLNMPGKNGLQCLREIKNDPVLKNLPVVIYSTSSLAKDIKDTHSMGADLYLKKPNSFGDTISLVKKVFAVDFSSFKSGNQYNNFVLSSDIA